MSGITSPDLGQVPEQPNFYQGHNFYILHGNFQPKMPSWTAELQQFLIGQGVPESQTHTPFLKNQFAKYNLWLKDSGLSDTFEGSTNNVIIGHSSGAEFAMFYAQNHQVAGLILMAPYDKANTGGILGALVAPFEKASGMFKQEFRWGDIAKNSGFIIVVHSNNDSLIPEKSSQNVFYKLSQAAGENNSKIKYLSVPGKGHDPEVNQLPQIFVTIK